MYIIYVTYDISPYAYAHTAHNIVSVHRFHGHYNYYYVVTAVPIFQCSMKVKVCKTNFKNV